MGIQPERQLDHFHNEITALRPVEQYLRIINIVYPLRMEKPVLRN
ncbi:unnamed protein product [Larinioides sclopetarius]|uniref:Uncharacterized protein n=1 Tax=Larinioides sclopetarius TaxID=280406 RepID=A0AAV1Z716_9ARAC